MKLFSNFLTNVGKHAKLFVSVNGYGQKISFTPDGLSPEKVDFVRDVALAGIRNAKSLTAPKERYMVETRRKRSGTADQFAMHKANIRYSYALETRDDLNNGFFVPSSSIEENAREIFKIITGMVQTLFEY